MVYAVAGNAKMKIKLNSLRGPVHVKDKGDFWFASAETTPKEECIWSSIRWSCVFHDNPPPKDWAVGVELDVRLRSIDYEKGVGSFDVKG